MKFLLFLLFLASTGLSVHGHAEQPSRILVLGDSLSAGYGMELNQGWVALLETRLQTEGYRHQVINASVSGETAGGGLGRLPALLQAHTPDLVILELGGNDGLRGHPVNIMEQELAAIIEQSQAAGARVLLVGIQIPPNYGARYSRLFAQAFPRLAERYQIPLVPFFLEGVATDSTLMQSDGIHPRAEAQPLMLETVWPYLQPLL